MGVEILYEKNHIFRICPKLYKRVPYAIKSSPTKATSIIANFRHNSGRASSSHVLTGYAVVRCEVRTELGWPQPSLDVLLGQLIKLIHAVSTSEFHQYWWSYLDLDFLVPAIFCRASEVRRKVGHKCLS